MLFLIYDHFSKSKTEGAIMDIEELLDHQLVGDNLRAFDTGWDEILFGIDETPNDSWLERPYHKQIKKSDQCKEFLALYHQDIVINGKQKSYERIKFMVKAHLEEKTKEFHRKAV